MITLAFILIAALAACVIALGGICIYLLRRCGDLNSQLVLARREYREFQNWMQLRILEHRKNCGDQSGDCSNDCSNRCPIFD